MWDVRNTQIMNLEKTDASQTTLYLTVFRFDPDYRLNFPVGYDIYITSSSGFLCYMWQLESFIFCSNIRVKH